MMEVQLSSLDISEVLRYMGCPAHQADQALVETVTTCAQALVKTARPRWTYRTFSIPLEAAVVRRPTGCLLPGQDRRPRLSGCHQVAVFCATLSPQVDSLIRQAESRDMLQALALDCCATAAVEQVCDEIETFLHGEYPGCYFPFRYSPGYGDLPLSLQGPLLALLDAPRKIGLCASATHILTPRKSVTALIGVSHTPVTDTKRSCLSCPAGEHCQYRKAGGHCGSK